MRIYTVSDKKTVSAQQAGFTSKMDQSKYHRKKENRGAFGTVIVIQRNEPSDKGVATGNWGNVELGIHTYNLDLAKTQTVREALDDILETAVQWQNESGNPHVVETPQIGV